MNITTLQPGETATEPGLYRMTAEQYFADPCPTPSLSSSTIRRMLQWTPAHAAAFHPRIGGQSDGVESTAQMTFGTVVHALVLGVGRAIRVIDARDWRTKAAQAARDEAEALGLTPILAHQYARAEAMASAIKAGTRQTEFAGMLETHQPELVAIWFEDGVWCRAMMDMAPVSQDCSGYWTIGDLKTTELPLREQDLSRKIASEGGDIQDAFYVRGMEHLTGGRARFVRLFAESSPPFMVRAALASGEMRTTGEQKVMAGLAIWRRCLQTGHWPGYQESTMRLQAVAWQESAWADREASDPLIVDALKGEW